MVRIAQFFYNHRDDRDFPSPSHLAVMDEDESEALGNDLYLDVTTSGGSLRSMLPHARFIHAAYKPPTPFQMSSWRSWLRDRLGVHTQPRIVGGRLSPEFREMVKSLSAAPSKLLRVLQEYWHYISEEVSPDGLEELSQVAVVCMDGARHQLAETALRRRSLSLAQIPSQCLHFVDAPNPDDHQWDFLAKLGVMLEPNAHAWLEVLKRLQMTAQPSPASLTPIVEEAYKQLDARFNEASGDIRRAFREYPLLLLTSRDDGDVSTKCQWIGMNGAYWHGPSYLKDILIEPSYPWMKEFFVDRLGLASLTPPSVVIDRLLRIAETEADKPLPQSVQNVVEDILLTLSEWRVQPLTSAADIASQLKRLKDKAIFPVKATDSGLVTLRRVDGFYVHRGQLKEAEMVMGRVPLLATTLKLRIPDIQPLLDGDMWSTSVKYLEPPVLDIQYGFRGEFEPCTSLRERFTDPLRLECIRSTICYKLGRRSRWRESRELQFADKLQTLTIGIVDAIMLTISLPAEKISHETYLPSHLEETDDALVLRIARESISTADGEFTLQLSRHLSGVGIDLCRAIIYVQQPLQTVYNILREEGIDIIRADYLDDDGHTFHWGENQHMQLQPVLSESGSVKERLAARDDHGVTSGTGSASSTTIAHTAPQSGQQSLQTSVIETRSHRSLADQVDDAVHDLEKNFSVISLDADAVYTPESLKNTQSEVDLPSMVTSISRPKASKSSLGAAASTGIPGTDMSDLVAAPAAATNRAAETTAEASGTVGRISTGATSGIASLFVALASPAAAFDSISDHQIINGIMGERYAYEVLRKLLGPNFGPDNWTSELRGQVPGFTHYEGDSLADFRCPDDDGILTRLWYGGEVKQRWQSDWPTYHIEVKSTSRSSEEPFHMKRVQLRTVSL
ncbi:hypothetical protein EVJ58_g5746 [Rhodofomes roseus]|uniref:Uncharacterized protein n=1 Tax=Rhodofomes roseus TaxID=34475 RepID=A0A4Y9YC88_9APHY|nr:hypothetical protein EVJ58_g5746 [Rhodofomes roseus]